jgi:glycosyltransferase involved in cell wall biosynthesis
VVTRGDAVGGATVHVFEMARAMRERGHEVAIFVGGEGPAARLLAESGAPAHTLRFLERPVRPGRDLRAHFELAEALGDFRPDLVSTHTAKAGWVGRSACARLGIPAVHTPHGLPVGERMPGARGRLYEAAERIAAGWARAVICVSESERRVALAHSLARPERLVVVPNGVRDIPADLRADAGAQPPRIVSVARFEAPKDHATLLRALARLKELEWELELAGDGPLEADCRALAAELGIGERIRYLGYAADVAALLARAQIFVLSSRSEALPRSVLEAMRAGLAIAASNVGGLPESITDGANGALAPRGDAGALAEALAGLIADGPRRLRLGAAARADYEVRFRLEYMIEKTASVYGMALGQNAQG